MSLSLNERRELHVIDRAVRRSDPGLAVMLATFGRMAAGEGVRGHQVLGTRRRRAWNALLPMIALVITFIIRAGRVTAALILSLYRLGSRPFRHSRRARSSCGSPPHAAAQRTTDGPRRHSRP